MPENITPERPTLAQLVEALEAHATKAKTPGMVTGEDLQVYFAIKEAKDYDAKLLYQMRCSEIIFCGDCDHCLGKNSHECDMCLDYARRAHGTERMTWRVGDRL